MKNYWFTLGSVRGECGHRHTSVESAEKCMMRDERECKRMRGYSDRIVRYMDAENGVSVPASIENPYGV